jgi:MFS family permease
MPTALLMMAASGLAPRVAARAGRRAVMAAGIAVGVAGLALMAVFVSVDGGYLSILPGMLAMGLGMGLTMTPATEAITGSLPRDRQGVASALNDVTRELGTALGVALLGTVLTAGYRDAVDARLAGVPGADSARQGLANALTAPPAVLRAAQESFVDGWRQSMWAGAGVLVAVLVFVLSRAPGREDRSRAIRSPARRSRPSARGR